MASFEQATRVVAAGDGRWTADLDPEWTVGGRPHGGYLLAVLARAVLAAAHEHPHPLSASAIYASSPAVGPATVAVEVVRRGRRASQVRARLAQQDSVLVDVGFVTGALEPETTERWSDNPPPSVAPIEDCTRIATEPMGGGFRLPMLGRVGLHLDAESMKPGSADLRGWLTLDDGSPFDALSLLYAADAFPPATLPLGSVGWVPTLELTCYVRAIPALGPLRVRQRARVITGGLVDQVCEIWDSHDRVVVQATQLASARMPDA